MCWSQKHQNNFTTNGIDNRERGSEIQFRNVGRRKSSFSVLNWGKYTHKRFVLKSWPNVALLIYRTFSTLFNFRRDYCPSFNLFWRHPELSKLWRKTVNFAKVKLAAETASRNSTTGLEYFYKGNINFVDWDFYFFNLWHFLLVFLKEMRSSKSNIKSASYRFLLISRRSHHVHSADGAGGGGGGGGRKRPETEYSKCDVVTQDKIWKQAVGKEAMCLKNWWVGMHFIKLSKCLFPIFM